VDGFPPPPESFLKLILARQFMPCKAVFHHEEDINFYHVDELVDIFGLFFGHPPKF